MILFIFASNCPTVQQTGYYINKVTDYYLVMQIYNLKNNVG